MSQWWQFDRDEPGETATVERITSWKPDNPMEAAPGRVCQVCGAPVPDARQQPLPFCPEHSAERDSVLTQLDVLDSQVFAALAEIRQLVEAHPSYLLPFAAANTLSHIEGTVRSVRQFVETQSRKRAPRY